jgi:hypothetical protein
MVLVYGCACRVLTCNIPKRRFPARAVIRPHNFPLATPFNDSELATWQTLHKGIFKLAKDRAISPALVDWNVFVSDAYKQHYDPTAHSDTDGGGGVATVTALANQYNRECITQVRKTLGQLQPFMAVFLLECMGQLASFGPT